MIILNLPAICNCWVWLLLLIVTDIIVNVKIDKEGELSKMVMSGPEIWK